MVQRNSNIAKLQSGYLFPEIGRRKNELLKKNPQADIISLGIGDTTEPLSPIISRAMSQAILGFSTREGYHGYGDEKGLPELRKLLCERFYPELLTDDEIFISDGAKCDIGRLQLLFGCKVSIAVQDPSYPVYVDGSVIMGNTGSFNLDKSQFSGIHYLPCSPENNFFPDLKKLPKVDLIYFCSPNNPTGAVATHKQLEELVEFAIKNNSIIVYDSAYSQYITDKNLPKSIFEIPQARKVAIEVGSFSKIAGFTGIRLGWVGISKELVYSDNTPVMQDWVRVITTIFNAASYISQTGGIAALQNDGYNDVLKTIDYYMNNAAIIHETLSKLHIEHYGGINSPYIWARIPKLSSWETFNLLLNKSFVVTTPGSGFGPSGEGFIRFSAFNQKEKVEQAMERVFKELQHI